MTQACKEGRRRFSSVRLALLVALALAGVAWVAVPTVSEWRFVRAWDRGDAEFLNTIYGFPRPVRFVTRERAPSGEGYTALHNGSLQFGASPTTGLSLVFAGEDGREVRMPAPRGWARDDPLSAYVFGRRTLVIPGAHWHALPEHEVEIAGGEIRIRWKATRNQRPMQTGLSAF